MQYAKAYASLIGAIASALLGVYAADTTVGKVLTVVAVVATAVVTWRVPNALAPTDERGEIHAGLSGLIAVLLGVFLFLAILWLVGIRIHVG